MDNIERTINIIKRITYKNFKITDFDYSNGHSFIITLSHNKTDVGYQSIITFDEIEEMRQNNQLKYDYLKHFIVLAIHRRY